MFHENLFQVETVSRVTSIFALLLWQGKNGHQIKKLRRLS
jgi:hypothetical protein